MSITLKEFLEIIKGDCFYCGSKPIERVFMSKPRKYIDKTFKAVLNGIDRINSEIGYTKENCVPCCGTCNMMKYTLTVDAFMNHVKKIVSFLQG